MREKIKLVVGAISLIVGVGLLILSFKAPIWGIVGVFLLILGCFLVTKLDAIKEKKDDVIDKEIIERQENLIQIKKSLRNLNKLSERDECIFDVEYSDFNSFSVGTIFDSSIKLSKLRALKQINAKMPFNIDSKITEAQGIISLKQNQNKLKSYVVIHVDTTGLDYEHDKIVKLSAIRVEFGQRVDSFSRLIDPKMNITDEATDINGLKDSDLKGQKSFVEVYNEFKKFVGNNVIVLHDKAYEYGFLNRELSENNLEPLKNKTIDVMDLWVRYFARTYARMMKSASLETMVQTLLSDDDRKEIGDLVKGEISKVIAIYKVFTSIYED